MSGSTAVDAERVASLLRHGRELMGDPDRAAEAASVLGEAMHAARALDDELSDAHASLALGELALLRGELEAAPGYLRWAARIYEDAGHTVGAARSFYGLGEVARGLGDLDVAKIQHERAFSLFAGVGDDHARAETALRLGEVAALLGEPAEAMKRYRDALKASEPGSHTEGLAALEIGRLCLEARDPHTAARHFERAVLAFNGGDDSVREARARRLRGRALVETREYGAAVEELEEALRLVDGGREELDVRHDLSIALREVGRPEEAYGHFTAALAGYKELNPTTEER